MEFWIRVISSVETYLWLFIVLTVMGMLSRGRSAIRWSWESVNSGLASLGLLYFNTLFGAIFFGLYFLVNMIFVCIGCIDGYMAVGAGQCMPYIIQTLN